MGPRKLQDSINPKMPGLILLVFLAGATVMGLVTALMFLDIIPFDNPFAKYIFLYITVLEFIFAFSPQVAALLLKAATTMGTDPVRANNAIRLFLPFAYVTPKEGGAKVQKTPQWPQA